MVNMSKEGKETAETCELWQESLDELNGITIVGKSSNWWKYAMCKEIGIGIIMARTKGVCYLQ